MQAERVLVAEAAAFTGYMVVVNAVEVGSKRMILVTSLLAFKLLNSMVFQVLSGLGSQSFGMPTKAVPEDFSANTAQKLSEKVRYAAELSSARVSPSQNPGLGVYMSLTSSRLLAFL